MINMDGCKSTAVVLLLLWLALAAGCGRTGTDPLTTAYFEERWLGMGHANETYRYAESLYRQGATARPWPPTTRWKRRPTAKSCAGPPGSGAITCKSTSRPRKRGAPRPNRRTSRPRSRANPSPRRVPGQARLTLRLRLPGRHLAAPAAAIFALWLRLPGRDPAAPAASPGAGRADPAAAAFAPIVEQPAR